MIHCYQCGHLLVECCHNAFHVFGLWSLSVTYFGWHMFLFYPDIEHLRGMCFKHIWLHSLPFINIAYIRYMHPWMFFSLAYHVPLNNITRKHNIIKNHFHICLVCPPTLTISRNNNSSAPTIIDIQAIRTVKIISNSYIDIFFFWINICRLVFCNPRDPWMCAFVFAHFTIFINYTVVVWSFS